MIWFTSDWHINHQNIIKYCNRPFNDVEEMNNALVHNFNSVVNPDDIVYFVGDIAMGNREESLKVLDRLNCKHKYLVSGNHDDCHQMYKDKQKFARMRELYFEHFDDILDESYEVAGMLLCHFPYRGVTTDGRTFGEWEPEDRGQTLLCGHIHDEWATKFTPQGTLMFNVGVDASHSNFTPVSLIEVQHAVVNAQYQAGQI